MAEATQHTNPEDEIPSAIIDLCGAFASCLNDLNNVQQQQMEGILDVSVEILEAARAICDQSKADANEAAGKLKPVADELEAVLEKHAEAAKSAGKAAQEALAKAGAAAEGPEPEQPVLALVKAIVHALGQAAHNAVVAQQQGAVMFQAAVAEGVSTLYSLGTACIAKDAKKK